MQLMYVNTGLQIWHAYMLSTMITEFLQSSDERSTLGNAFYQLPSQYNTEL